MGYVVPIWLKRTIQLLGVIGVVAGAYMFELENSFVTYPNSPRPDLGMTVAYPFKGATFFITPEARARIKLTYIAFLSCWGVILLLGMYVSVKMGFPIKGQTEFSSQQDQPTSIKRILVGLAIVLLIGGGLVVLRRLTMR